jgi:cysteine synthase
MLMGVQSFYDETGAGMNILKHVGNTPLVKLKNSSPNPRVNIFAKLEMANPTGSLKDRIALYMIEQAEKRGELEEGMTIIEATSGNTGIALGMVAAVKGYKLKLFMLESKTIERRKLLKYWGADLVLTTKDDPDSHIKEASALAKAEPDNYFYINQNENPDNVWAHYHGTGQEVAEQMLPHGTIDYFLTGFGTGGCLMGVGKYFRDNGIEAKLVGVEPKTPKEGIDGLKNRYEEYQPPIYEREMLHETIDVEGPDAVAVTKSIAANEGLIAGISSGAQLWAAQQLALKMESGNIVVVFCDRGERYFSTDVFKFDV